jgi:hypothetical protein
MTSILCTRTARLPSSTVTSHELSSNLMRSMRISSGGQLSLPADVRRRWATERVVLEDLGDHLVIRPLPADPVGYARGAARWEGRPLEEIRDDYRREDAEPRR